MGGSERDAGDGGSLISVDGLSAAYRTRGRGGGARGGRRMVHAVHDVDFELKKGQTLGIAGESACGKSTLGLAVMRMLDPGAVETSGRITCGGESILEMPESGFDADFRWKRIAMIFQGAMNSLDPVFTIREQFSEVLSRHGYEGDANGAISRAVREVNLPESVLSRYPHELSGGMKQRVVISMALLLKPELVIADEPTTALDVLVQAQVIALLKSLKSDEGMSFILITHDLAVLSEIADVVGIMYGGQIVEFGSLQEVYENPRHPYTQGLLRSIPTMRGGPPSYIAGVPPALFEEPRQCRFIDRCPYAMEKCTTPPPKFETKTGYAMCWLEEENASPQPGAAAPPPREGS
ncbi:MAG: ABC transporter ATP-binding protein [Thaumarchaeota archaeon]|nr:ABC transporter ATP-binding protein [Nitrososphaerota archaeon]MDE0266183.1 ABC transporter ATP-binding protein [Nitrososphaerota archaeon]